MNTKKSDEAPSTLNLIANILRPSGKAKSETIIALGAVLNGVGLTIASLHNPMSRELFSTIHSYLHQDTEMRDYIQHILNVPGFMELDPLIREIFLGTYLIASLEVQRTTKGNVGDIVSPVMSK